MTDFTVNPVIVSLTRQLADWPLCRLFLYNDSRYQWGLLVPRRPGAVEMCDLSDADQAQLMKEIVQLSNIIRTLPGVEKSLWTTRSTLMVYLADENANPVDGICQVMKKYEGLRTSRVHLQPPAGAKRPARFLQCATY